MTLDDLLNQAQEAHARNDLRAAEAGYRKVLAGNPNNADAIHFLGLVLHQRGLSTEGTALMIQSTDRVPSNPEYLRNLALAYDQLGWTVAALDALQRQLALSPDDVQAHLLISKQLASLRRPDEALEHAEAALKLVPNSLDARFRRAGAYINRNDIQLAMADIVTIINEAPDYPAIFRWLLHCLDKAGQIDAIHAIAEHKRADAIKRDRGLATDFLFFDLHSDLESDEQIFETTRQIAREHYDPFTRLARPTQVNDAGERRTIAFIGGEFNYHVMMYFLLPLLKAVDKERFQWIAYQNGAEDEFTEMYREAGVSVIQIAPMSDHAVAEMIRSDKVDVLIDINAHSGLSRLGVLARRPAPLQMTWLGYAGTTALDALDYRITDAWIDPPGLTEHLHTEKLLRLPASLPFGVPDIDIAVPPLPALTFGHVRFGVLNRPAKSARMMDTYAEILARVPSARMTVVTLPEAGNGDLIEAYLEPFVRRGIRDRVDCIHSQLLPDFLKTVGGIDIALDSFPYSGGVTTFHTLWMGVPIVTRRAVRSLSRVTGGVLESLGYVDWITESDEAFVERAISMAADLPALADIRSTLRHKLESSVWCDAEGAARALEAQILAATPKDHAANWGKIHNDVAKVFLHVGCGPKDNDVVLPEYLTSEWQELRFDIDPSVEPDIVGAVQDMHMIPDNAIDAVWSCQNLEHLPPHHGAKALREFLRVLKPAGELRMQLPNLAPLGEFISAGELDHVMYESPIGPITVLDILYGHGESMARGNDFMAHRTGYTERSLRAALEAAGFVDISTGTYKFDLVMHARKPY